MPYQQIADLPKAVRDTYTAHQQRAFLAALNAAMESGKDESAAFAIAHTAAQGAKSLNGFKRLPNNQFMAWYTNAYQDRDKEWFAETAIDKDISRMVNTKAYPELWFWHIPWLVIGKADYVVKAGRFAVAFGRIADTPIAQALATHAENQGYTLSHGFTYEEKEFRDNTYHDYETFEISVLPSEKASNPFTHFMSVKKTGGAVALNITDEQLKEIRDGLSGFGIDIEKLVSAGEQASKQLDQTAKFKQSGIKQDEVIEEAIEALDTPSKPADGAGGLETRLKAVEDAMAELKGYMQSMAGDMKTLMPKKPVAEEATMTEEMKAIKDLQAELKAVKQAAESKAHSVADSTFEAVLEDMFDLRTGGKSRRRPEDFDAGDFLSRMTANQVGGTSK